MRASLGLVGWLLSIGCGATPALLPPGPTAEQACTARAQAECALRDTCSNHFLINRTYGDLAACASRVHDACVASLAAPSTGLTIALVQSCAAAYPAVACADYLNGNLPAPCLAQPGSLAAGAPCHFSSQCQGAWCAIPTGSQCGVCSTPPAAGAACNGTGATQGCGGHGLHCAGEVGAAPGTCAALGAAAAACDATHRCGAGLACTSAGTGRTCQPAGATVGAPCRGSTNADCDNELGLACNATSHTCQPITIVAAGAACGLGADGGFSSCAAGGDCLGYSAAMPRGTCRAAAADGAACDRVAGPFCKTPSACVAGAAGTAGTCQSPSAATCH